MRLSRDLNFESITNVANSQKIATALHDIPLRTAVISKYLTEVFSSTRIPAGVERVAHPARSSKKKTRRKNPKFRGFFL